MSDPTSEPRVVLRSNEIDVRLRPSLIYAGQRFRLSPEFTIGSSDSAGLRLEPRAASSEHAVVRVTTGAAPVIEDISGVGLLVNGEVIRGTAKVLSGGDRITIGGEPIFVTDGTEAQLPTVGGSRSGRRVLTIGSSQNCDVTLHHPAVLPIHAAVEQTGGGAFVRDHSGRAELLVDGIVSEFSPLQSGSEIGIGPFRLLFDGETLIVRDSEGLRLTANQVSQVAGGRMILMPTTVSVRTSEMMAIVGPSGAGKSTLLRLLAATSLPHQGIVTLGAEPISTRRSELGYVPQDEIVHRELSVVEALTYAACLRLPQKTGRDGIRSAVNEIMAELGLTAHANTRVGDLSGGQRKRVGLATELVHQPEALLLDEPTTGLDPALERRTMRLLRRLANDRRAVVLVTHATRSLELCDKVLVLTPGGFTAFLGSPREARSFFGVAELDEIYDVLLDSNPQDLAGKFETSGQSSRVLADAQLETMAAQTTPATSRQRRLSYFRETAILVSRYAKVFVRDRRSLALLILQAPLLGILAAMLFRAGALSNVDRAKDATNLIFLLITISIWMGAVSASREIVREKPLLMRETALGIRLTSYLTSKMAIVGTLAITQVLLMTFFALTIRNPNGGFSGIAGLIACLVLSGLVSVTLGLAISAYASTENQANSLIPLALVPQLLLGGAIVAVARMPTIVKDLSPLIFSRWSFAAAGDAYHLESRIEADPGFSRVQEYGFSFFNISVGSLVLIASLFMLFLLGLTALLIVREDRASG